MHKFIGQLFLLKNKFVLYEGNQESQEPALHLVGGVYDENSTVEGRRTDIGDGNPSEQVIIKQQICFHHCHLCKGSEDAKGFISKENKPEAQDATMSVGFFNPTERNKLAFY